VPRYPASSTDVMDEPVRLDRFTFGALLSHTVTALVRSGAGVWRLARRRPYDALAVSVGTMASFAIIINAVVLQPAPHPAPMLPVKPRPVAVAEATGSVTESTPRPQAVAGPRPPAVASHPVQAEPAQPARPRAQIVADIQRELSRRGFFDGQTNGVYGPKTEAAIREFAQAAGLKTDLQPDEALLRAIARAPLRSGLTPAAAQVPAPPPRAAAAPPAPSAAPTPAPPPRPTSAHRPNAAAKQAGPNKRVLAVQRALADFGYGQVTPNGVLGPETKAAIERFERERKLPVSGQISERLTHELAAVTGRQLE